MAKASLLKKASNVFALGKNTKFNALQFINQSIPGYLNHYQSIWVCDDDIIIDPAQACQLPDIIRNFGLSVLSPAHSPEGKLSHRIMVQQAGDHFLRFTNFVEMTCPMFTGPALLDFLHQYDGSLSGFGMDWWYGNVLRMNSAPSGAITDAISIVNPHDQQKTGGHREISSFADDNLRKAEWKQAMEKHKLKEWLHKDLYKLYRC